MLHRTTAVILPDLGELGIVGTLLFVRPDSHRRSRGDKPHGPQVMARSYDRFPMGKGQAPGIETGLGVCGTGSFEACWAFRASGAGRRRGTAGFFLAAFFLADFLVGFFLGAFRAPVAAPLPELRCPDFALTLLVDATLIPALPGRLAAAERPGRFPAAPAFAAFLRGAFFFCAMPSPMSLDRSNEARPVPYSRRPGRGRQDRARDCLPT